MRLAVAVHLVEQRVPALGGGFRQGLAQRLPGQVAPAHQRAVGGVHAFEDMVGPAQHAEEARRLLEQRQQPAGLARPVALGEHLAGGLGADDQHPADAVRRRLVVDRPVGIGPVDLLQPAMAPDRQALVLMPGGLAAGHHLLDLRADDVPDLDPGLAAGHAEDDGVLLRPQRGAVGIVIEAEVLRPPEQEDGVARGERGPHRGLQGGGPGFRRTEAGRRPVMRADAGSHPATTGEEARAVRDRAIRHRRRRCGRAGRSPMPRRASVAPCGPHCVWDGWAARGRPPTPGIPHGTGTNTLDSLRNPGAGGHHRLWPARHGVVAVRISFV